MLHDTEITVPQYVPSACFKPILSFIFDQHFEHLPRNPNPNPIATYTVPSLKFRSPGKPAQGNFVSFES